MELQPYFDKLNGDTSSKEILTPGEYEQYIEALMTYGCLSVRILLIGKFHNLDLFVHLYRMFQLFQLLLRISQFGVLVQVNPSGLVP